MAEAEATRAFRAMRDAVSAGASVTDVFSAAVGVVCLCVVILDEERPGWDRGLETTARITSAARELLADPEAAEHA